MTFDPNRHMIQLRQKGGGMADYLPVAARIAWFRDEHPDGAICVEAHVINEQVAIFHARVSVPGGGSAEGWGSETPQDFKDYIEKGSTKAVGRALLALGYGALQAGEELDEGERIVDAPVDRQRGSFGIPDYADPRDNQTARTSRAAPSPLPPPARPVAPPSGGGPPPNLEAVRDALETQADRQTPEGAIAWLMRATTKADAEDARKRCQHLEIEPSEWKPIYNDTITRLQRTA